MYKRGSQSLEENLIIDVCCGLDYYDLHAMVGEKKTSSLTLSKKSESGLYT